MAIALGFKTQTTGVGHDSFSVTHQIIDVLEEGSTLEEVEESIRVKIFQAEKNRVKLNKLEDQLDEYMEMTEKEYCKKHNKYSKETRILSYDTILFLEGHTLNSKKIKGTSKYYEDKKDF
jgi:hypothetical protein